MVRVGDKFNTRTNIRTFIIESISNDGNVIIMWKNDYGNIERTDNFSYTIDEVENFFNSGTWKSIKLMRREKLLKLNRL
jgi:hypothetical protein